MADAAVANACWTDSEQMSLFEYLLGADVQVKHFKIFQKGPECVFKQVMKHKLLLWMSTHSPQFQASGDLFYGHFSPASCKGQFNRSPSIFKQILNFESVTGGGGDADLIDDPYEDSDDEEEYKEPQQRSDIQNKCISALGLISCRSDIQNERVNMRTLTMRRNTKKPQYRSDIQDEGKAYQTGLILPADTMGRGLNRERMKWR